LESRRDRLSVTAARTGDSSLFPFLPPLISRKTGFSRSLRWRVRAGPCSRTRRGCFALTSGVVATGAGQIRLKTREQGVEPAYGAGVGIQGIHIHDVVIEGMIFVPRRLAGLDGLRSPEDIGPDHFFAPGTFLFPLQDALSGDATVPLIDEGPVIAPEVGLVRDSPGGVIRIREGVHLPFLEGRAILEE